MQKYLFQFTQYAIIYFLTHKHLNWIEFVNMTLNKDNTMSWKSTLDFAGHSNSTINLGGNGNELL